MTYFLCLLSIYCCSVVVFLQVINIQHKVIMAQLPVGLERYSDIVGSIEVHDDGSSCGVMHNVCFSFFSL